MTEILNYVKTYGIDLSLIAVGGIIILGILKYCNLFKFINERTRHYVYLTVSVGLSVISTAIYLLIIKKFNIEVYLAISSAIFALNQTFYNVFKITPINELTVKLIDCLKNLIVNKTNK